MLALDHYRLPESVPTAVVFLVAAALVAAWVGLHLLKRWPAWPLRRAWVFGVRAAVGTLALLAVAQAMMRWLVLATNWPVWPLAITGALAVEVAIGLYALERQIVSSRVGLALAAMRVALVLLVVGMLAQPVRRWEMERTLERYVAVLLDNSASMHVSDSGILPGEKVRLAEMLGVEGVSRPYRLEDVPKGLAKARQELEAQVDWLASLNPADLDIRKQQFDSRRDAMRDALKAVKASVDAQILAVQAPLGGTLTLKDEVRGGLRSAAASLEADVSRRLGDALEATAQPGLLPTDRMDALLGDLRRAVAQLGDWEGKTARFGDATDEACYTALAPEVRERVDQAAGRTRFEIAGALLRHRARGAGGGAKAEPGLLGRLADRYAVRFYTFASRPTEVNVAEWEAGTGPAPKPVPVPPSGAAGEAQGAPAAPDPQAKRPGGTVASLPPEQQHTDMAAAVEKVASDVPAGQLAGIVLVTDGRQNGPGRVETFAHKFGLEGVPVSSIVMGGEKPPRDAAIVSVEAPETIFPKDKMYMNVSLKLDGLAGQDVKVALLDGDKEVASRTVRVPGDTFRTRVQLGDEPADKGLHAYRVEVPQFDGEVLASNNAYPVTVNVSDEQVRALLVDRRPRWEFRYLKNLFASRDRTVRLQYVLLEPDVIADAPKRERIPASVTRKSDDVEATALPENEAEWMKFDVIVLGDLAPSMLSADQQKILGRFVRERGGTLLVVAGPEFMPRAFADMPLAEVLPVRFQGASGGAERMPERSFRFALTPEGRESVVTRLAVDPEENLQIWGDQPEVYWRYPIVDAKEGASVLAYALPPSPPEVLRLAPSAPAADAASDAPAAPPVDEATLAARRQFERSHALIAVHQVAMGQVMFLATDRTWRLRYRTGDTLHHRLWGQILRWATTGKLPDGTEYVRVGADRWRYGTGEPIRVRAKIVRPDYSAVVSDDVWVNVFRGETCVERKKMAYLPNSAGMYAAELGALPGGTYRVELDAAVAKPILAADKVDAVATRFSVDVATPVEQVELAPDRGLLGRLAELTGGTAVGPSRALDACESLGPGSLVYQQPDEFVLWDSWHLLVLIVALATGEWVTRKKVGLA